MVPDSNGGFSFTGRYYNYLCREEIIIKNDKTKHRLIVEVSLRSIRWLDFNPMPPQTLKIEKKSIKIECHTIPDDNSITDELIWLSENNYGPSYTKDLDLLIFEKKNILIPLTNFVARASVSAADKIVGLPAWILYSPIYFGKRYFEEKQALIENDKDQEIPLVHVSAEKKPKPSITIQTNAVAANTNQSDKREVKGLARVVARSMSQQVDIKLPLDSLPSPSPKPIPMQPNIVHPPKPEASAPDSPQMPDYPSFPLDSLRSIFDFLEEHKIYELIKDVSKNTKADTESYASMIMKKLSTFDPESPLGKIIKGNSSYGPLKSIAFKILSIAGPMELYRLYRADRKNPDDLKQGGVVGELIININILLGYLNSFYKTDGTLDYDPLVLSLLQNTSLCTYLEDEKTFTAICNLIMALDIPNFTSDNVKDLLKTFTTLQKLVTGNDTAKNCKSLGDIPNILKTNILELGDLLVITGNLIKGFTPILNVLLNPDPYPLQCLLNSKKPENKKHFNIHGVSRELFNCKDIFEKYIDESLGVFGELISLPCPIATQIKSKNLNGFIFTELSEAKNDAKNTVYTSFDECAFENFSFGSHFNSFSFNNAYFKKCDFSNAKFSGLISIAKDTYMDEETALSFQNALLISVSNSKNHLEIEGLENITIVNPSNLAPITVMEGLKTKQKTTSPNIDVSEKKEEKNQKDELPETDSENYVYGTLKGFAGFGYTAAGLAGSGVKSLFGYGNQSDPEDGNGTSDQPPLPTRTVEDMAKETNSDYKSYIGLETKLQKHKREIENEIFRLRSDLSSINKTTNKEELDRLNQQITKQQDAISDVQKILDSTQEKRIKNEKIEAEQQLLLNHPKRRVKEYYQTLLTNLCSTFQAIALLNTKSSAIQFDHGKPTVLANCVDCTVPLIKEAKKGTLEAIGDWFSKKADHLIGFSSYIEPILSIIPNGGGAISGCVNFIVDKSDKNKINQTKKTLKGLTPSKLEKIADEMARKFTFAYEEQIGLLESTSDAKEFAEIACETITGALFTGQIHDKEDFTTLAFLAIRRLRNTESGDNKLSSKRTTQEKAKKVTKKFSANSLYCRSGIKFYDNGIWIQCAALSDEDPKKYLSIRITKTEKEKYFPDHMPILDAITLDAVSKPTSNEALSKKTYKIGERTPSQINHIMLERISNLEKIADEKEREYRVFRRELNELRNEYKLGIEKDLAEEVTNVVGTNSNISPGNIPQGLPNLGTSCYMNAALQVIFNIPSVCALIKDDKFKIKTDETHLEEKIVFKDLLGSLFTGQKRFTRENLLELRLKYFQSKWPADEIEDEINKQQASEEFLGHIFDFLDWKPLSIEDRCVENNGEISRLRACIDSMIKLSFPENYSGTLEEALNTYFTDSMIEKDGRSWIKKGVILNSPEYIFIELKRGNYKNNMFVRNNSKIIIPSNQIIQMACEDGNNKITSYKIVSYISHRQTNIYKNEGHYTAYINDEAGNWYHCDDDRVNICNNLPQNLATHSTGILLKNPSYVEKK